MQEIRSHLLSVAVILMITGVISKLTPENSNKAIIRFIVTVIIFSSVFGIDFNSVDIFEDISFTTDIYVQDSLEDEIQSYISETLHEEIVAMTDEIVEKHCSSAKTKVTFDATLMSVTICHSENINNETKKKIENDIMSEFDGDIILRYEAVEG